MKIGGCNLKNNGDVKVIIDSSYVATVIKLARQHSHSKRAKNGLVMRFTQNDCAD